MPPHRWPGGSSPAPLSPRGAALASSPCTPQCSSCPHHSSLVPLCPEALIPVPRPPPPPTLVPRSPFLRTGAPTRTLGAPACSRQARTRRHGAQTAVAAGGAAGAERGQLRPRRPRHRGARLTRLLRSRSLRRGASLPGVRSRGPGAAGTTGRVAGSQGERDGRTWGGKRHPDPTWRVVPTPFSPGIGRVSARRNILPPLGD